MRPSITSSAAAALFVPTLLDHTVQVKCSAMQSQHSLGWVSGRVFAKGHATLIQLHARRFHNFVFSFTLIKY